MNKFSNERVKGFLRAGGRKTVNGDGEKTVLRGWGAGNWMNPEGFMTSGVRMGLGNADLLTEKKLCINDRYDRRRTMDQVIRELCGSKYAESFWPRWYRSYLAENDLKSMNKWGFNSIRLPLDASALLYEEPGITYNEDSFKMLDDIIDLCEKYSLYVILDLHGTPGHSGVKCDNGIDNVPRLFLEEETFERMVTLWTEIARRYKDRWIVAAYELLNEPLFPAWRDLAPKLEEFYDRVIQSIRKFDKKHMFILSAPLVGTDVGFFKKNYDPECNNWAYTVHGYHFTPEMEGFYKLMDASMRLNIPMIHGEGRGDGPLMAVFYEMLGEHDIGYCMFCWKSEGVSGMVNSPVTHRFPDGWNAVAKYISEGGPRPSYSESQRIFNALLECVRYENCEEDTSMYTYSQRMQGITLAGVGYDAGEGEGITFSGGWKYGNPLNYRVSDRTKLVVKPGVEIPATLGSAPRMRPVSPLDALALELSDGGFANYTIRKVSTPCKMSFEAIVCEDAEVRLSCGADSTVIKLSNTNGRAEMFDGLLLKPSDEQTTKLTVLSGCILVCSLYFPI